MPAVRNNVSPELIDITGGNATWGREKPAMTEPRGEEKTETDAPDTAGTAPPPLMPTVAVVEDQGNAAVEPAAIKIETRGLSLSYGSKPALKNISAQFESNSITALIGPSGCGKSTFLRCL